MHVLHPVQDLSAAGSELSRLRVRAQQGDQEAQRVLEIAKQVEKLKLSYQLRPLLYAYGGFGTSIQFDIAGTTQADNDISLLIAVPLYAKTAVDSALALLSHALTQSPARAVRVAFLANEREGHLGLLDQLDQFNDPESVVILYGDFTPTQGPLYIYQGSAGHIGPRQLLEQSLTAGEKLDLPIEIAQPYNELFRFGWIKAPEALQMIQDRGYPALYYSNSIPQHAAEPTKHLKTEQYEQKLASFLENLIAHIPRDPALFDNHYSLLAFNKQYLLIDEQTTILLIVGAVLSIILFFSIYSILFRRKIMQHWLVFLRRSWVILIYYIFLVASLYMARLCMLLWFLKQGSTAQFPQGMALVFLVLWLSLFSVASPVTKKIVIPKRSSFYGHSAVVVLVLGLLTSIAMDISLIPVFIWALLWVFIGSFVHSFSISLFSTILAPAQVLILFLIGMMQGREINSLLVYPSNIRNSLLFAFLVLPFVLLWKRTTLLRIQKSKNKDKAQTLRFGRYIFASAMILAIFTMEPLQEEKQPAGNTIKPLFTSTLSQSEFLHQRSVAVTITAKTPIEGYEISLESPLSGEAVQLIDSTIPFESNGVHTITSRLVGHPDNPFYFELLLPKDQRLTLRITGRYGTEAAEEVKSLP
uniref:Uncharacterized protein n=1 Tax=Gracilinema caldarium TaxID=215591 RepID=A0A7C3E893_9SPIR